MQKELINPQTVYIKGYEILEDKVGVSYLKDVETPIVLIEEVENFKENTFWVKIRNLWVLIGKIPPLEPKENDIVLFHEDNRWGLFKYLGEDKDGKVVLTDGKEERKTRVDKEVLEGLKFFGKILRVQEKV